MDRQRRTFRVPFSIVLLSILSACGGGTAVIFNRLNQETRPSGNRATVFSSVEVQSRLCPAIIDFVISDEDGDLVDLEVAVEVDGPFVLPDGTLSSGGSFVVPCDQVVRVTPPPSTGTLCGDLTVRTTSEGVPVRLEWDYESTLGCQYRDDVRMEVRILGSTAPVQAALDFGNDTPSIEILEAPTEEVSGIVAISLEAKDSAGDPLGLLVEYDVVGDGEVQFLPAQAVGLDAGSEPFNIDSSPEGVTQQFAWDVVQDLGLTEQQVRLRLTAADPFSQSITQETEVFQVDNNEVPRVELNEHALISNPDQSGTIPIRVDVTDPDSEEVRLVLQWTTTLADYPDLPDTRAELQEILDDPAQRKNHRILTEKQVPYEGKIRPLLNPAATDTGDVARLPELAGPARSLLGLGGVEGRELEILRPNYAFLPVPEEFGNGSRPVAAVPVGSGEAAVVLDSPFAGSWRLTRRNLGSGRVLQALAVQSLGDPLALSVEPLEEGAVILSSSGSLWSLHRVDLTSGQVTDVIISDDSALAGSIEQETPRAVLSLGRHASLLSLGNSLVRLQYTPVGIQAATLLGPPRRPLAEPWGMAFDPWLGTNVVYVALHAAEQILRVDLRDLEVTEVVTTPSSPSSLVSSPEQLDRHDARSRVPAPLSLAFETPGRLLVLSDDPTQRGLTLYGLDLNVNHDDDQDGLPDREVFDVLDHIAASEGVIASGRKRVKLLTLQGETPDPPVASEPPGSHIFNSPRLLVAGGLEQSRTVVEYDHRRQKVRVDRPFEPDIKGQRYYRHWRINTSTSLAAYQIEAVEPESLSHVFLWDSAEDVPNGASVFLRATAYDSEKGVFSETIITPKIVAPSREEALFPVHTPEEFKLVDLDCDGDLDVAVASRLDDSVVLKYQDRPGCLDRETLLFDSRIDDAKALAIRDFDENGLPDIAAASIQNDRLLLFWQDAEGEFGRTTDFQDSVRLNGPFSVASADLNSDGFLDLAVSCRFGQSLAVILQRPETGFEGAPIDVLAENEVVGFSRLVTSDVNKDGRVDILCSSPDADPPRILLFQQGSSGGFVRRDIPVSADLGESLATADLNLDGLTDVIFGSSILLQGVDGTFSEQVGQGGLESFILDHSRDGLPDLLVSSVGPESRGSVHLQDRPGNFAPPSISLEGVTSIAGADLNGDNRSELIVAEFETNRFGYLTRNQLELDKSLDAGPLDPVAYEVVDLDGNGLNDLLYTDLGNLYEENQLSPGVFTRALRNPISAQALRALDLDGNGLLDLAYFGPGPSSLELRWNFSSSSTIERLSLPQFPATVIAMALGDFNSDGLEDVACVWKAVSEARLTTFLQLEPTDQSRGRFSAGLNDVRTGFLFNAGLQLWSADLDTDGDADVILSSSSMGEVVGYLQGPSGQLSGTPFPVLSGVAMSAFPHVADVDSNGEIDFVFPTPAFVHIYHQRHGSFPASPLLVPNPQLILQYDLGDVNGDGDLDFLGAPIGSGHLTILEQFRPGQYRYRPLPSVNFDSTHLFPTVVDLNNDGDLDFVVGNVGAPIEVLQVYFQGS
jgi:hypothetical protein